MWKGESYEKTNRRIRVSRAFYVAAVRFFKDKFNFNPEPFVKPCEQGKDGEKDEGCEERYGAVCRWDAELQRAF